MLVLVLVLLNAWLIPEDGGMEGVGRQRYQAVGAGASGNGEDDGSDGEVCGDQTFLKPGHQTHGEEPGDNVDDGLLGRDGRGRGHAIVRNSASAEITGANGQRDVIDRSSIIDV